MLYLITKRSDATVVLLYEHVREGFPQPADRCVSARKHFFTPNIFTIKYNIFIRDSILLILNHNILHCLSSINVA